MIGFLVILLGLLTGLVGAIGSAFGLPIHGATGILLIFGGVVLVIVGLVMVSMSFYRRTTADIAFVRTGMGGSRVVLDGGILVIPFLHNLLEINLQTMKLGVNPKGPNALITRDNLRANVMAQFYIRVQADTEHILNAARSLGQHSVDAEAVEALVSEKLISALRAIASQMDLFEIHTKRDEFAERVKEHVRLDLESNGLLLESVTISELDQTDPTELSDNNVFDAQGKRKITEITAAAAVERNNLEREAERARKLKDVETRQQILELEKQQAEAEALQATEIAKIKAEKDREAQEALIAQQRALELARIEKDRLVQEQEIARQKAVEVARTEQELTVQTAQIARDQQVQAATVAREKSIALAEREKEIALAQKEAERARAEEEALRAAAEKEKANQQVATVVQLAEAEREANKKLIAARQEIEQGRLKAQTSADVEAYMRVKQAEGDLEAAQKQAEAKQRLAEAEAQARELAARGERALQMVSVDVAREQVNVEQAKVEVERQQLQNRQEFAEAGIRLEVQKLTIQAERDVQIEFAKALANFLANGHMTLYGTPETATVMLDNMAKGFGLRTMIESFLNGSGKDGSDGLSHLTAQLGQLLKPALTKLGADGTQSPDITALAESLASNPDFLKALQAAIAAQNVGQGKNADAKQAEKTAHSK
ncbi:MAG TPA: SPFH domain-containing protein [Chthonomonas sp.]|jgi:flotillin|uniref:SPFH domain-containing protein n=1 Tax=Chthonomonas sp. TaxID=2282153 RepID=UPI002B4ACDBC|nr:SPFH domain-containing protein [Chthonomonas sp.]HLH78867.1 SPFH domain-containing protein [Chthonomonas sp.]